MYVPRSLSRSCSAQVGMDGIITNSMSKTKTQPPSVYIWGKWQGQLMGDDGHLERLQLVLQESGLSQQHHQSIPSSTSCPSLSSLDSGSGSDPSPSPPRPPLAQAASSSSFLASSNDCLDSDGSLADNASRSPSGSSWSDISGNSCILLPQPLESLRGKRIVQLACGATHNAALSSDGDVYTWGWNWSGQIGHAEAAYQVRLYSPSSSSSSSSSSTLGTSPYYTISSSLFNRSRHTHTHTHLRTHVAFLSNMNLL